MDDCGSIMYILFQASTSSPRMFYVTITPDPNNMWSVLRLSTGRCVTNAIAGQQPHDCCVLGPVAEHILEVCIAEASIVERPVHGVPRAIPELRTPLLLEQCPSSQLWIRKIESQWVFPSMWRYALWCTNMKWLLATAPLLVCG